MWKSSYRIALTEYSKLFCIPVGSNGVNAPSLTKTASPWKFPNFLFIYNLCYILKVHFLCLLHSGLSFNQLHLTSFLTRLSIISLPSCLCHCLSPFIKMLSICLPCNFLSCLSIVSLSFSFNQKTSCNFQLMCLLHNTVILCYLLLSVVLNKKALYSHRHKSCQSSVPSIKPKIHELWVRDHSTHTIAQIAPYATVCVLWSQIHSFMSAMETRQDIFLWPLV